MTRTKKKTAEEIEYDLLCSNVRELMSKRQGQDVVWYILSLCNLFGDVFQGNSRTFYDEGKRAVGLEILALLEDAEPTLFAKLLLDKNKKERKND